MQLPDMDDDLTARHDHVTTKEKIELMNFSIEFLDKSRNFHGFFLKNCKISGIFGEFGHF